jgi:hypothetical protein
VDNVDLLQTELSRNDFTHHGLHLNISGKGKIAELIGKRIKNLIRKKEEDPIRLKWKNLKKPAQEETKRKPTKDKKTT